MEYKLLSPAELKAIDRLKEFHGGAKKINKTIEQMRKYETRKQILAEKGFADMIEEAEELVQRFPKLEDFEAENNITYKDDYGLATAQVSGWQGAKVTHHAMQKIAASAETDEPCFVASEFISVVALTDNYIYNGDLMATLMMAENIMQASKFCSTNLIGIPQPEARFAQLEELTGSKFERTDVGNGMSQLILKNQGTFFGNFGGIEVANNNHLVYLDGITRTALATGANFFLNPSWSTIVAACYYGRDIPNLHIKISMLLSIQNTMQFRLLLNIIKQYLRADKTSPIYEINIGNGVDARTFMQCAQELKESGIKGISLAAHIYINPDLGMEGFNWTDNAFTVLENGTNMTFKYESDGTSRELDTMEAYFLSEEERQENAAQIGDVIYHKSLRATKDGKAFMEKGIKTIFAASSRK